MVDLHWLEWHWVLSILLVLLAAGSAQCALAVLTHRQGPQRAGRVARAFEWALVACVVAAMVGVADAVAQVRADLPPQNAYEPLRWMAGGAALLCAGLLTTELRSPRKAWWGVPAVVAAVALLPVAERLPVSYAGLLVGAAVLLGLRALALVVLGLRRQDQRLVRGSVKRGIDQLPFGLLCADPGGRIVLINRPMRGLMRTLLGEQVPDSHRLWRKLVARVGRDGVERVGDGVSCRAPDGSVWLFTQDQIPTRRTTFHQIVAQDVTEEWRLTQELRAQAADLQGRREQLLATAALALRTLRQEEVLHAKAHVHDLLGQRLSMLMRVLRDEVAAPADLSAQLDRLRDELRAGPQRDARRELETLRRAFAQIDVALTLPADWPADEESAGLFAAIVREATTNAVKHGSASRVLVDYAAEAGTDCLTVTNDGRPTASGFRPGGGLAMIRERLEARGGELSVAWGERFRLRARLPRRPERVGPRSTTAVRSGNDGY